MSQTWLIGDTHFGHENILKFTPPRPFDTIEEHDQTLIDNWNSVVRPDDKVYHVGDVGFKNATYLGRILSCLNGTKVLIKGNHDQLKLSQYALYFKDVRAYHQLDRIILAHIPIHPASLGRWKGQIHGHTHFNSLDDPRYYNVSVEVVDYTPVNFDTIKKYYDDQKRSS